MKILLLNYEFPPFGGGAGKATWFMARELARAGHDVHVLTSGLRGSPSIEKTDSFVVHRVASWRRGVHEAGLLGALTYLVFGLRRLHVLLKQHDFDLAHFYFALPTGLLAPYWRMRTRLPYIVSLRGSDVPNYDNSSTSVGILHRLLHSVTASILANASRVVANSRALRTLALESFPDQAIEVVTNAVCTDEFSPNATRQVAEEERAMRVICVARIVSRKGLDDAIRALQQCRHEHIELHLVGLGPHTMQLRELTRALGLGKRVFFHGHLQGKALAKAYRNADVFLLPSRTESFSMALLEAMASGLPVVATDVGGIPELVVPGKNGILIPPANPEALASALDQLCADPHLRSEVARNNRNKIERDYTWSHITDQYLKHYRALPAN